MIFGGGLNNAAVIKQFVTCVPLNFSAFAYINLFSSQFNMPPH